MKPQKRLEAWKQSFDFVKEIYILTQHFPAEEKFELVSQLRRAAVSVPVNIAEGAARHSPKEFVQFLYIALGSVSELDTLLELGLTLGLIADEKYTKLNAQLETIGKLIYGLINKVKGSIKL